MSDRVIQLLEEQGRTFEAFKKANDERLTQIENKGAADVVLTEQVSRMNDAVTNLQAKVDDIQAEAVRPTNGATGGDSPEKRTAFFNYMRGRAAPGMTNALVQNDEGEILVPEDLDAEIHREIAKIAIVRGLCAHRTTTSNRVRRRSLTEVQMGWGKLELGRAILETTLSPSEAYQYVEDLYGLTKIGEDELMDTDVNLQAHVVSSFARAAAETEDGGFIVGRGHDEEEPEGMLNGNRIDFVESVNAGAISSDDFIRLEYAIPAAVRNTSDCAYIVASTTELAMRLLRDEDGRHLWQPSLQAGRPNTFNGYGVYNQEDVPAIAAGADSAVFGNYRIGYRVVDRMGLAVKRLDELFTLDGLVGFKGHFRVTGGVIEKQALRKLRIKA
jgi:HK97 family phage major capsid protein